MNNVNVGNSGEYFVAGELERRGFGVAVPMSNTKEFDILTINMKNKKQYAVQVKTTTKNKKKWILKRENEHLIGDNIIYVFVYLNNLSAPKYYIVPSKIVAETIIINHQVWLNSLGRNGKPHKDSNMRKFEIYDDKFLNNWDLFK